MENFKIFKIHISYIIGFLVLTIIGLITIKWYNIPNLVDYIAFALTLSSLVLSLLAIIYSFVSNNRFSESIGALNNVSDEVLDSSKKLNLITDDLAKKVEEIPIHLKNVEEQTEKTHQLIESMKMEKESVGEEKTESKGNEENNFSVLDYINYSSFSGKLLFYALSLSYNQKKGFILEELFPKNHDYMNGYLVSSSSMGLISYSETKKVIIVTQLNETILKNIKESVHNTAAKHDENSTAGYVEKYSWIKNMEEIQNYFDSKI